MLGAKETHPWLQSPQDWDPLVQSLHTDPKAFDVLEPRGSDLGPLLHRDGLGNLTLAPTFASVRVRAFLVLQTNGFTWCWAWSWHPALLVFTSQAGKRQPTSACLSQAPKEVAVILWDGSPRSLI